MYQNSTLTHYHADPPRGKLRIALYSPGAVGLGHMRRNLLVGQALALSRFRPTVLMIAEVHVATAFGVPPGMDILALPAFRKSHGQISARYLDLPSQELAALRRIVIRSAIESFNPDVFIVDYLPRGLLQELEPTLTHLRLHGNTQCVLGLRDIIGDPEIVRRYKECDRDAIRDYYNSIWVYGDRTVYDIVREYNFTSEVAEKVHYTGYLDQHLRLDFAKTNGPDSLESFAVPPHPWILCLVGGGQDGIHLAETFLSTDLPAETAGVILTGPFMPLEDKELLRLRAGANPRFRVIEFFEEPIELIRRADRVIAMGGYNTTCEILSFEKPALIVPRVKPHLEQVIRAERLHDLGLLDIMYPEEMNAVALKEWLDRDIRAPIGVRNRVDFNGLARLPGLLEEVLLAPV